MNMWLSSYHVLLSLLALLVSGVEAGPLHDVAERASDSGGSLANWLPFSVSGLVKAQRALASSYDAELSGATQAGSYGSAEAAVES